MSSAIEITQLTKSFRGRSRILNIRHLSVEPGEMVALIGSSGSGKSTLLRHIVGLTLGDSAGRARGAGPHPEAGLISVFGNRVQAGGRLGADIRRKRAKVGLVFQQFNLVERLPVLTNVLVGALARVPLWRSLSRRFPEGERRRALDALARVGIADLSDRRASTLSGGQQQRAAIARALVQGAEVLLADEPIASLDPESSRRVMELLRSLNRNEGITVLVSLHQVDVARQYCRRVVGLKAGEVVFDGAPEDLTPSLLADIYGAELRDVAGAEESVEVEVEVTRRPAASRPALTPTLDFVTEQARA